MSTPTSAEIAEWRALCEAATAGPWVAIEDPSGFISVVDSSGSAFIADFGCVRIDDAKLTAAARSAMPRLLAELEFLRSLAIATCNADRTKIMHARASSAMCRLAREIGWKP